MNQKIQRNSVHENNSSFRLVYIDRLCSLLADIGYTYPPMLTPLAKIAAIPKDHITHQLDAQQMCNELSTGKTSIEEAMRWATARLLAHRIGESRTVMRRVFMLQNLDRQEWDVNMAEWEYTTSLRNGHLAQGLNLYGFYRAYSGETLDGKQAIAPELFNECANICLQNNNLYNAIVAFEHAGNEEKLRKIAVIFQKSNNPEQRECASIARKALEEMTS